MIDIHLHALPGVDDGASDIEEALIMAEMASEGGAEGIMLTPHANIISIFENYYDDKLRVTFNSFKESIKEKNIALDIYEGMEIYGTEEVPRLLKEGRLISLNNSRYILIEFPFEGNWGEVNSILNGIKDEGYVPIIAHPERYACVQRDIGLVEYWLNQGYHIQVNKGSILGSLGRGSRITATELLNEGFVDFIASDGHGPYRRTPYLDGVRSIIEEEFSIEEAIRIFDTNPLKVIRNEDIR